MTDWDDQLRQGAVLLLDGAMGTELQCRGVPMDATAWCGCAVLDQPDVVRAVHADYIAAGARVLITNTFGSARHVLAPAGRADQVEAANREAVTLARQARDAAGDGAAICIAGSISSFAAGDARDALPPDAELAASLGEQAAILADAGADVLLLEMLRGDSISRIAVDAACATGLPVWAGYSCEPPDAAGRIRMFGGPDKPLLQDSLGDLAAGRFAVAGIMHSEVEAVLPALQVLRPVWPGPLLAYAHSGDFVMPHWRFDGLIAPQAYAAEAQRWVAAGAQIVGGCCGLGPAHIAALRDSLPTRTPR